MTERVAPKLREERRILRLGEEDANSKDATLEEEATSGAAEEAHGGTEGERKGRRGEGGSALSQPRRQHERGEAEATFEEGGRGMSATAS